MKRHRINFWQVCAVSIVGQQGTPDVNRPVSIELLADHRELLPLLQRWFESEWPSCYGPNGEGDAGKDLRAFANGGSLPIDLVTLRHGVACGVAALKRETFASRRHLSPWAAAGLVLPVERRKGIGSLLLAAVEGEAHKLNFRSVTAARR